MKKLLALVLCLVLAGCSFPAKDIFITDDAKSDKETKAASLPRNIDASSGISKDGRTFSYIFDFDGDQEKESVKMKTSYSEDTYEGEISVTIGNYSRTLDMMDGRIDAVYICDINTSDGVYDIAIITNEVSDDPRVRILNYNPTLDCYVFETTLDEYGESRTYEDHWLGYAINYYFNVNDDDTITMEEQTPSYGMWSVYKTYEVDHQGLSEIVPEKYEILPDFMEDGVYFENMEPYELEMWNKGYIKAYCNYKNESFEIEKGEFVKPIYDDGDNNIYVEKENGKGGWMDIDYAKGYNPMEFNSYFFFLAG